MELGVIACAAISTRIALLVVSTIALKMSRLIHGDLISNYSVANIHATDWYLKNYRDFYKNSLFEIS